MTLANGKGREYKGLMGITEALGAGKALVEASKLARDLINHPDVQPDRVRAIVQEMMIHLTNAQTGLAEAQQEIMELRHKVDDRTALLELAADMDFQTDGDFFVQKSESGKGVIAYCPMCWKDNDKAVPMQGLGKPGSFRCNIHKVIFKTKQCIAKEAQDMRERDTRTRHGDDVSFWAR